ncbi:hypothetical protein [Psychrobacter sp. 78a-MNA-CIBAN-0178]|uniref:hypothetical protein n=1 Tax=Psychrobacter sp. 78a-MNA-CIBAN-0178 TaxID=3140450 RepID=UPI0033259390
MFAAIMMIIIIWIVMWGFYKFMYPRAPRSMMPKDGDVTTPRHCDFCGNSLAEYRGVLETKPNLVASSDSASHLSDSNSSDSNSSDSNSSDSNPQVNKELFFCNYEHQADFHAGKVYSSAD